MKFIESKLQDAYIIEPERREDERGFFARTWCQHEFSEHGLPTNLAQCNIAYNKYQGILRGMHYQAAPYAETKLVRCTQGAIYDVIIDIRPESTTYKQWIGVELTAENRRMLFVPEGFAHGYQTLSEHAEISYQVTQFYQPDAERGIRWNDTTFGIEWPHTDNRLVSEKDQNWPDFTP